MLKINQIVNKLNFCKRLRQEMLLSWNIDNDILKENLTFLQEIKESFKIFRRYCYFLFSGQKNKEQNQIYSFQKRIIWLSYSNDSYGDTLMDLSGRILFDNSYTIDVLIQPNNKPLFEYEKKFNKIIAEPSQLKKFNYDLAIIDIFGNRSLKIKNNYLHNIPFVSMGRFFYGYEFNRVYFSFYRLHKLLNLKNSQAEIDQIAKPYLFLPTAIDKHKLQTAHIQIAIALGGKDQYRTYTQWDKVINALKDHPNIEFLLLGNSNGVTMKEKICDNPLLGSLQIKDYVNKLNIIETAQIIQKSNLLLTADGGLLHIANSFNIRSISLFAKRIQPKFRLVKKIKSYALYNQDSVDNIDYNEIVNYINLFLETPYEN